MRCLVALSGGIDSSVAAHLLSQAGHELVGVQFSLWSDPLAPPLAQILPSKCCNAQTQARAKSVAKELGIELHKIDLSKEFKQEVVDPFLKGYASGLTPNPCIGCNKRIKFGRLLELMKDLECEKLATGHYARIAQDTESKNFLLLEAVDALKDQSYYLYGLTQQQLSRVLFPLGSLHKHEVFSLAQNYGVPLPEHYQESQDLCFFPEKEPHEFLKRYLHPNKGTIVDTSGHVRGTHKGLPYYTEGQRKGLGIGGLTIPLHVIAKDVATNTITVGSRKEAMRQSLTANKLNWISWTPSKNQNHTLDARIHSLGTRSYGIMKHNGNTMEFRFATPQLGIAPGQSIVLYQGKEIIGGGVIT